MGEKEYKHIGNFMGKCGDVFPNRNDWYIKYLQEVSEPALQVVWEVRWSLLGFTISLLYISLLIDAGSGKFIF